MWVQKAEFPPIARHRSVGFSIGSKGYLGLGHINAGSFNIVYADFWEFDPVSNSWTQKADYGGGQRFGAVGFSIGNKGYIGLGTDQNYADPNDFWEYDPLTNVWTQRAMYPSTGSDGAIGFSIGNKGYAGMGYTGMWCEYDPAQNLWTPKQMCPVSISYGASFVIDTLGYVTAGSYAFPCPLFAYSPALNQWIGKAAFPGQARFGPTGFAINHKGYVGIGCDYGYNDFKDFFQYNPDSDTWDSLPEFPGSRRHYVPGFNIGNKGYCGTGTNGTNLKDVWEFYNYIPFSDTTGVENILGNIEFILSPNPITTSAKIHSSIYPFTLELFDLSGRKIFSEQVTNEDFVFDRKNISSGIYLLSASVAGERIHTEKIILP